MTRTDVSQYKRTMGEGWLIDANDHWVWRFHRDDSALVRDPKVFIDRGRQMPEGPPLLKERRYLRKDAAEQMWKSLQNQGWKKTTPPGFGIRRSSLTEGDQCLKVHRCSRNADI